MEPFTEDHDKDLLNTEWLVKVEPNKSTPFLFKYGVSIRDLSCYILITDTKSVWVEVLTSKQIARRWRECNPQSSKQYTQTSDEEAWRENIINLLSNGHSMGGMLEMSLEEVKSNYSDFAFVVECEAFKWRWETCFLGHRRSSEIISKHLIFPLISLNHLTFSSAHSMSELSDTELEQSVGKLGQTARRATSNHIRTALSKPRVATAIRRMTALFNFIPDLSTFNHIFTLYSENAYLIFSTEPITSIADKPLLKIENTFVSQAQTPNSQPPPPPPRQQEHYNTPQPEKSSPKKITPEREPRVDNKVKVIESASETESDSEPAETTKTSLTSNLAGPSRTSARSPSPGSPKDPTPPQSEPIRKSRSRSSLEAEVPPPRPVKKTKPTLQSSSGEDSDQDVKKSRSSSAVASGARRGTRQPIKRGGKKF
uniref:XLF-like N-terminal domain-containing protein n=1 Tax=Psilocybe cubensis TaxID=181762 RepID=A0A8H8CM52_PSICU